MRLLFALLLSVLPTTAWAQTQDTGMETYRIRICFERPYQEMPDEIRRRHAIMVGLLAAAGNKPDCRSCVEADGSMQHVCYAPRTSK